MTPFAPYDDPALDAPPPPDMMGGMPMGPPAPPPLDPDSQELHDCLHWCEQAMAVLQPIIGPDAPPAEYTDPNDPYERPFQYGFSEGGELGPSTGEHMDAWRNQDAQYAVPRKLIGMGRVEHGAGKVAQLSPDKRRLAISGQGRFVTGGPKAHMVSKPRRTGTMTEEQGRRLIEAFNPQYAAYDDDGYVSDDDYRRAATQRWHMKFGEQSPSGGWVEDQMDPGYLNTDFPLGSTEAGADDDYEEWLGGGGMGQYDNDVVSHPQRGTGRVVGRHQGRMIVEWPGGTQSTHHEGELSPADEMQRMLHQQQTSPGFKHEDYAQYDDEDFTPSQDASHHRWLQEQLRAQQAQRGQVSSRPTVVNPPQPRMQDNRWVNPPAPIPPLPNSQYDDPNFGDQYPEDVYGTFPDQAEWDRQRDMEREYATHSLDEAWNAPTPDDYSMYGPEFHPQSIQDAIAARNQTWDVSNGWQIGPDQTEGWASNQWFNQPSAQREFPSSKKRGGDKGYNTFATTVKRAVHQLPGDDPAERNSMYGGPAFDPEDEPDFDPWDDNQYQPGMPGYDWTQRQNQQQAIQQSPMGRAPAEDEYFDFQQNRWMRGAPGQNSMYAEPPPPEIPNEGVFWPRRQYDEFIDSHPKWMSSEYPNMQHKWSLGGVFVQPRQQRAPDEQNAMYAGADIDWEHWNSGASSVHPLQRKRTDDLMRQWGFGHMVDARHGVQNPRSQRPQPDPDDPDQVENYGDDYLDEEWTGRKLQHQPGWQGQQGPGRVPNPQQPIPVRRGFTDMNRGRQEHRSGITGLDIGSVMDFSAYDEPIGQIPWDGPPVGPDDGGEPYDPWTSENMRRREAHKNFPIPARPGGTSDMRRGTVEQYAMYEDTDEDEAEEQRFMEQEHSRSARPLRKPRYGAKWDWGRSAAENAQAEGIPPRGRSDRRDYNCHYTSEDMLASCYAMRDRLAEMAPTIYNSPGDFGGAGHGGSAQMHEYADQTPGEFGYETPMGTFPTWEEAAQRVQQVDMDPITTVRAVRSGQPGTAPSPRGQRPYM